MKEENRDLIEKVIRKFSSRTNEEDIVNVIIYNPVTDEKIIPTSLELTSYGHLVMGYHLNEIESIVRVVSMEIKLLPILSSEELKILSYVDSIKYLQQLENTLLRYLISELEGFEELNIFQRKLKKVKLSYIHKYTRRLKYLNQLARHLTDLHKEGDLE